MQTAETKDGAYVRVASVDEVRRDGKTVVRAGGRAILLVADGDGIFAIENRCPHMGFPLHRGTVRDGILTCDWHHARFDLCSGGTFDLWADDARSHPVEVRDGEVWLDPSPAVDVRPYHRRRLVDGLEHRLGLVLAKSAIALLEAGEPPVEPFRTALDFGCRYREDGWGQGLTQHVCFMNLLPHLDDVDVPRALYQGFLAVAADTDTQPVRFVVDPLPDPTPDAAALKRWFRRFIEVRDAQGAERCIVTAVRTGASPGDLADMLYAATTDHRYLSVGHVLDFTNKALEALDTTGWEHAEAVLTSLVRGMARAMRAEESLEWRHPDDVVAINEEAFERLPDALDAGAPHRGDWRGRGALVELLLGPDPGAVADAMLSALRSGAAPDELAGAVAYAAALRIARFPTSNEFSDWDTALHTFTFANAVHQGLRRVPSVELLRGAFDAAMSVYLDRFLNASSAGTSRGDETMAAPEALLDELPALLDRQQQVNEAGRLVATYLRSGGTPDRLVAVLGKLLLREDRDFHTIQTMEAAVRQHELLRGTPEGADVLVAAARYLAAHSPTVRAQGQTYTIAERLHRGEELYGDVS